MRHGYARGSNDEALTDVHFHEFDASWQTARTFKNDCRVERRSSKVIHKARSWAGQSSNSIITMSTSDIHTPASAASQDDDTSNKVICKL